MARAGEVGPEDEELSAGTAVGEYVVEHKLGEGAFGKVYRGRQPLIGKAVAIKLLSRTFSADPEMVSRFVAEARAVNQIAHRNIIDIFSFGHLPDGRLYFVMELLQGRTLEQVLRARGFLSVAEALPILRGLARALDAAHAQGIAHRDLKPANVFVTTDDDGQPYPKLLDFGIAKLVRPDAATMHKTRTGAPMGTPYYMSPEQCRGETIDTRTDAYSFGVMIFQVLTGQLPFSGDSYVEILFKHMTIEPPAPSSVSPAVPSELDAVILGMLAKSPSVRPGSLVEAVRALEAAAVSLGVSVPRSFSDQPLVPRSIPPGIPSGAPGPSAALDASGLASTAGAFAATAPSPSSDPGRRPPLDGPHSDPKAMIAALVAPMGPNVLGQTLPAPSSTEAVGRPRRSLALVGLAITVAAAVVVLLLRETTEPVTPEAPPRVGQSAPPRIAPERPTASAPAVVDVAPTTASTVAAEDVAALVPPLDPLPVVETTSVVRWRLEGTPTGAEAVDGAGEVLCAIPCTVELPRGDAPLPITFRAAGHAARTQSVVPADDGVLSVGLERKRDPRPGRPNRPRRPNKDDVEEAF